MLVYGYIRVSTIDQNLESQKNLISCFCMDRKLIVDKWVALEMSSRKTIKQRRIEELLNKLNPGDVVISSELSRLGRSMKETFSTVATIIEEKQARLILVKQNLDINPLNKNDINNKVLITIFSMLAELERDFISERTKEGLKARKDKGIPLGKPTGIIQSSIYDKDRDKIFHLHSLGVPLNTIVEIHLKYGKYLSLKNYIQKRFKLNKKNQFNDTDQTEL